MPFQNFRPLPMRITHKQYERLQAAREYDHLAIQEHVRRALDMYLDAFERKIAKSTDFSQQVAQPPDPPQPAQPPQGPELNLGPLPKDPETPAKSRKLVYR